MPKRLFSLAVALLCSNGSAHAASGYAGEFLSLGAGARSLALGSAYVAIADDAPAGYWNPAGLAYLKGSAFNFELQTLWSQQRTSMSVRNVCKPTAG